MEFLGNLLGEGEEPEAEDDLVLDLKVGLPVSVTLFQEVDESGNSLGGLEELDANIGDKEEVHEGLNGGFKLDRGGAPESGHKPLKVLLKILVRDGGSRAVVMRRRTGVRTKKKKKKEKRGRKGGANQMMPVITLLAFCMMYSSSRSRHLSKGEKRNPSCSLVWNSLTLSGFAEKKGGYCQRQEEEEKRSHKSSPVSMSSIMVRMYCTVLSLLRLFSRSIKSLV